jgi:hypothetical protein
LIPMLIAGAAGAADVVLGALAMKNSFVGMAVNHSINQLSTQAGWLASYRWMDAPRQHGGSRSL